MWFAEGADPVDQRPKYLVLNEASEKGPESLSWEPEEDGTQLCEGGVKAFLS